jgi:hypothetical protein
VNIDPFLLWLESTALSQWVVTSLSLFAFPGILALHAIGMAFAVGISAALDLRILGVAPGVPLAELRRFLPVLWVGFWVNAASGLLLLIGYPTKALTNPVFYFKLLLIGVAMVLLVRIGRVAFGTSALPAGGAGDATGSRRLRLMAIASLVCWAGAITAGRLLAYTYTRLSMLH